MVFYSGLIKEVLIVCEIVKNRGVMVIFIISNDGENVWLLSDEVFLVFNNEYFIWVGVILLIVLLMVIGDVLYLGLI